MVKFKKCTPKQKKKFVRCEKKVIKTVKARKGSTRKGSAIAICTRSIRCSIN